MTLLEEVTEYRKEVAEMRDILNCKENWHSEIKDLLGKSVNVKDVTHLTTGGTLIWSDRYTLCIDIGGTRRIYSKGSIVYIEECKP